MVLKVDHVDIVVRDLDKHVEFYQMLGFQVVARTSHAGGAVELRLPGPNQPIFEFSQASGIQNIGIRHIAFTVDNVPETYEYLKGKGVNMEGEPLHVETTGRVLANFRDPDGWVLQLSEAKRGKSH
ncbi:VOC family protein [Chloroflexota bacterium]